MKEKDARVDGTDHQMAVYVEKEDGTYGTIQTGSFMVKDYIDEYENIIKNRHESNFNRLITGKMSPVAFYMAENDMTAADVASRMKIGVGKVTKHMNTTGFGSMTIATASRYADLFGVSLADLFQIPEGENCRLKNEPTANPWIVLSHITKGDR